MSIKGIYIDDAGTPGVKSASPDFLHESRKSWAAVVVPETISEEVSHALSIITEGVRNAFSADELHFTDIYSGRGVWKKVSVNERIELFDLMQMILTKFSLPVFYQTWSEEFANDIRHTNLLETKIGNFWDFSKIPHFGLFRLLLQIKEKLPELRRVSGDFQEEFQLTIDQGLAKEGREVVTPILAPGILKPNLIFEDSKKSPGLQLADFAAFVISKSQWIQFKKKPGKKFSDADRHIIELASSLNHWTLDVVSVDEESSSGEGLEFYMKRDRMDKGLRPKPKK